METIICVERLKLLYLWKGKTIIPVDRWRPGSALRALTNHYRQTQEIALGDKNVATYAELNGRIEREKFSLFRLIHVSNYSMIQSTETCEIAMRWPITTGECGVLRLICSLAFPSVLLKSWHCWLGHLTRKNPSPIWPITLLFFFKSHINIVRCAECPANFTYIPSVNGCYRVATTNLEWSVAGLECRRLHKDAHLLVINDAAEQSAVAGMLASTSRQRYFVFYHFSLNLFWFSSYVSEGICTNFCRVATWFFVFVLRNFLII